LQVGDIVWLLLQYKDIDREGFLTGQINRTNQVGLFPEHKTKHWIETVVMPTYPEAEII